MAKKKLSADVCRVHQFPEVGSPFFWPMGIAMDMGAKALETEARTLKFLEEVEKIDFRRKLPVWASRNQALYAVRCFTLRDFSQGKGVKDVPVLLLPPYAGHTSVIADFHRRQSLVATLRKHGVSRVFVTDWHSATEQMKDYDIDDYLAALHVAVTDLGGRVHLIGLCQGGWMASLYAARFPQEVASLVLAGSPIDTQAGDGPIKEFADGLPFSFYESLVASGNGLLKGAFMLQGFKNMNPEKQYFEKYAELYKHIDDPDYLKRTENFARWYENTLNLPGRWYLQVVRELFRENRFVKGKFVGLGKRLNPKDIRCPVYLLAGKEDDITPPPQVFDAEKYFGTTKRKLMKDLAEGGHIGLFMGSRALENNWPKIALWLRAQQKERA